MWGDTRDQCEGQGRCRYVEGVSVGGRHGAGHMNGEAVGACLFFPCPPQVYYPDFWGLTPDLWPLGWYRRGDPGHGRVGEDKGAGDLPHT